MISFALPAERARSPSMRNDRPLDPSERPRSVFRKLGGLRGLCGHRSVNRRSCLRGALIRIEQRTSSDCLPAPPFHLAESDRPREQSESFGLGFLEGWV